MKYSRTAIGLLTAQYRSVLKKCLLINLGLYALGAVAATPASADKYIPETDMGTVDIHDKVDSNGTDNTIVYITKDISVGENSKFTNNKADLGGAIATRKKYGNLTLGSNSVFEGNTAHFDGGAIGNYGSAIIGNTVSFLNNKANINASGGQVLSDKNPIGGGAISLGVNAVLNLSKGTFTGNESGYDGGAIGTRRTLQADEITGFDSLGNSLIIGNGTTFTGNKALGYTSDISRGQRAGGNGGAIANTFATAEITGATFTSNEAAKDGGAIYNYQFINDDAQGTTTKLGGKITIADSSFTDNKATGKGGALYNDTGAQMTVKAENANVTFSGNKANGVDNDIYNIGTLILQAAANKSVILNGGIMGSADSIATNIMQVTGAGTVEVANKLQNQTVTNEGNLLLNGADLTGTTISGEGSLEIAGNSSMSGEIKQDLTIDADKVLTVKANDELNIENATLSGAGKLTNLANGTLRINDSTIKVAVNNAGILYSDPTYYTKQVVNTGTATFDGDIFESTSGLENTANVNLLNGTEFKSGAAITGNGTTNGTINLVEGTMKFNDTANSNTINLASGANWSGKIIGGTINTQNGVIDAITGAVQGATISLDANLKGTGSLDAFNGGATSSTITSINVVDSEYGTADHIDLNVADGLTLANDAKITGNSYYTKVAQSGNTLTFSDKLVNTSGMTKALNKKNDLVSQDADTNATQQAKVDVNAQTGVTPAVTLKVKQKSGDALVETAGITVTGKTGEATKGTVAVNGGLIANDGLTIGDYGITSAGDATVNSLKIGASGTPEINGVDTTPTAENTTKLITSAGVASALSTKQDALSLNNSLEFIPATGTDPKKLAVKLSGTTLTVDANGLKVNEIAQSQVTGLSGALGAKANSADLGTASAANVSTTGVADEETGLVTGDQVYDAIGKGTLTIKRSVNGGEATQVGTFNANAADNKELIFADTDTTYTNGTGLTLTGTTFAVDTTAIQTKLSAAAATSGITLTEGGAISVNTGKGLKINNTTGDADYGKLQVIVGDGLQFNDSKGVTVNAGSGLQFNTTSGAVEIALEDNAGGAASLVVDGDKLKVNKITKANLSGTIDKSQVEGLTVALDNKAALNGNIGVDFAAEDLTVKTLKFDGGNSASSIAKATSEGTTGLALATDEFVNQQIGTATKMTSDGTYYAANADVKTAVANIDGILGTGFTTGNTVAEKIDSKQAQLKNDVSGTEAPIESTVLTTIRAADTADNTHLVTESAIRTALNGITLTAGNGININGSNQIEVVADPATDNLLSVSSSGVKVAKAASIASDATGVATGDQVYNFAVSAVADGSADADDGTIAVTKGGTTANVAVKGWNNKADTNLANLTPDGQNVVKDLAGGTAGNGLVYDTTNNKLAVKLDGYTSETANLSGLVTSANGLKVNLAEFNPTTQGDTDAHINAWADANAEKIANVGTTAAVMGAKLGIFYNDLYNGTNKFAGEQQFGTWSTGDNPVFTPAASISNTGAAKFASLKFAGENTANSIAKGDETAATGLALATDGYVAKAISTAGQDYAKLAGGNEFTGNQKFGVMTTDADSHFVANAEIDATTGVASFAGVNIGDKWQIKQLTTGDNDISFRNASNSPIFNVDQTGKMRLFNGGNAFLTATDGNLSLAKGSKTYFEAADDGVRFYAASGEAMNPYFKALPNSLNVYDKDTANVATFTVTNATGDLSASKGKFTVVTDSENATKVKATVAGDIQAAGLTFNGSDVATSITKGDETSATALSLATAGYAVEQAKAAADNVVSEASGVITFKTSAGATEAETYTKDVIGTGYDTTNTVKAAIDSKMATNDWTLSTDHTKLDGAKLGAGTVALAAIDPDAVLTSGELTPTTTYDDAHLVTAGAVFAGVNNLFNDKKAWASEVLGYDTAQSIASQLEPLGFVKEGKGEDKQLGFLQAVKQNRSLFEAKDNAGAKYTVVESIQNALKNPEQDISVRSVNTQSLKVAIPAAGAAEENVILEAGVDDQGKNVIALNGATTVDGDLTADTLTLPSENSTAAVPETVTVKGIKTAVSADANDNYLVTSGGVNDEFTKKVGTILKETLPTDPTTGESTFAPASVQGILGLSDEGKLVFTEGQGVTNIASGDGSKSKPTTFVGAIENISSAMGMIHGLVTEDQETHVKTFNGKTVASTNLDANRNYIGNLKAGTSVSDDLVSLDNALGAVSALNTDVKDNIVAAVNDMNNKVVHKTGNETVTGMKTFKNGLYVGGDDATSYKWNVYNFSTASSDSFVIKDKAQANALVFSNDPTVGLYIANGGKNYLQVKNNGITLSNAGKPYLQADNTRLVMADATHTYFAATPDYTRAYNAAGDVTLGVTNATGNVFAKGIIQSAGLTFSGATTVNAIVAPAVAGNPTVDEQTIATKAYADTKISKDDIVTDWSAVKDSTGTADTKVASEKLVYTSLHGTGTNDGTTVTPAGTVKLGDLAATTQVGTAENNLTVDHANNQVMIKAGDTAVLTAKATGIEVAGDVKATTLTLPNAAGTGTVVANGIKNVVEANTDDKDYLVTSAAVYAKTGDADFDAGNYIEEDDNLTLAAQHLDTKVFADIHGIGTAADPDGDVVVGNLADTTTLGAAKAQVALNDTAETIALTAAKGLTLNGSHAVTGIDAPKDPDNITADEKLLATKGSITNAIDNLLAADNIWTGSNTFEQGIKIGADYKIDENDLSQLIIRDASNAKPVLLLNKTGQFSLYKYAEGTNNPYLEAENGSFILRADGKQYLNVQDGSITLRKGGNKKYLEADSTSFNLYPDVNNNIPTFSVENATGNTTIKGDLTAGDATKAYLDVDNAEHSVTVTTKNGSNISGFEADGDTAGMVVTNGTNNYGVAAGIDATDGNSVFVGVTKEGGADADDTLVAGMEVADNGVEMGVGDENGKLVAGFSSEKGDSTNTIEMGAFDATNKKLATGVSVDSAAKTVTIAANGTDVVTVNENGMKVVGDVKAKTLSAEDTITVGTTETSGALTKGVQLSKEGTMTAKDGTNTASYGAAGIDVNGKFKVDANGKVQATDVSTGSLTMANANYPEYSVTVTGIDKGGNTSAFSMEALATTQSIKTKAENADYTNNNGNNTVLAATDKTIGAAINKIDSVVSGMSNVISMDEYNAWAAKVKDEENYKGNISHHDVTDPKKSPTLISAIDDLDTAIGNRNSYTAGLNLTNGDTVAKSLNDLNVAIGDRSAYSNSHYANATGTTKSVSDAIKNLDTKVFQDIHGTGTTTDPKGTVRVGDMAKVTVIGSTEKRQYINVNTETQSTLIGNTSFGAKIDSQNAVATIGGQGPNSYKIQLDQQQQTTTIGTPTNNITMNKGNLTATGDITATGALSAENETFTVSKDDEGKTIMNLDGNENVTGNITVQAAGDNQPKVEIKNDGSVKTTSADGTKTVELKDGVVAASDKAVIGTINTTATGTGVEMDNTGKITSRGTAHDVVINNGDVDTYSLTMADADQSGASATTPVVKSTVTAIDTAKEPQVLANYAVTDVQKATLATVGTVLNSAENAIYRPIDDLKGGSKKYATAESHTLNEAIADIDMRIGDFDQLHKDTADPTKLSKNLTYNGTIPEEGDSTVVDMFNGIDSTLGTIHGLADSLGDEYKGNLYKPDDADDPSSVEKHLAAIDKAIGDRRDYTAQYNIKNKQSVAESLDAMDLRMGDVASLGREMHYYNDPNPASVNLSSAVKSLDSNLYRLEMDHKKLRHETHAGLASAAALSALVPNPRGTGDTTLSFGTGAYQGHTAAAFGGFHWITNNLLVNAGVGWDNREATTRIGVSYSF